jgi:hypothetical protein
MWSALSEAQLGWRDPMPFEEAMPVASTVVEDMGLL